jgi:serine protease Do
MSRRILSICLAILLAATLLPGAAMAEPTDARTLAMVNKPGVVLVYTQWTAMLTLYEFSFDDSLYDALTDQLTTLIEDGQIPAEDDHAIYSAMVQLLIAQMPQYAFFTGNTQALKVSTGAVGTGFIVTPDGYLITNAHVVESDEDELYYDFAVSNLHQIAEEYVTVFLEDFRRGGYQMSQGEIDGMYYTMFNLLAQSFEISDLQTSYQCYQGNVQPGSDISVKGVGMDLRKVGMPGSSKDVAILKLNGNNNLPTVALGDDSTLRTGDQVYAMGYPAVATVYGVVDAPQAMQEPTLTQGIVSAKKQWNDGGSVIQMDADIHGGNSGGPLFNADGEVVGINTFGLIDPSTGQQVSGMNFAIPISTVKTYLNELNITPSESKFTADFRKALVAYNDGDHNTALDLLRGINETSPGYPVVQELLSDARKAADAQQQAGPTAGPGLSTTTMLIIGGGALLVVVIAIILVAQQKKKKVAAPEDGSPAQVWRPTPQPAPQPVHQPTEVQQVCEGCQAPLEPGAKYCDNCGQPVESSARSACASCGAALNADAKFCKECGAKTV